MAGTHKAGLDEVSLVKTALPFTSTLLDGPNNLDGDYSIKWLENWLANDAGCGA